MKESTLLYFLSLAADLTCFKRGKKRGKEGRRGERDSFTFTIKVEYLPSSFLYWMSSFEARNNSSSSSSSSSRSYCSHLMH